MKITLGNYNKIDLKEVKAIDIHQVNDLFLCMYNNRNMYTILLDTVKKCKSRKDFTYNKMVKAIYNLVNLYLDNYNRKIYDNYFYTKKDVSVHDRFIVAIEIIKHLYNKIEE